jgi:hypothetical protein
VCDEGKPGRDSRLGERVQSLEPTPDLADRLFSHRRLGDTRWE